MTLDDLQTIISSLLLKGYHGFSLGFSDSLNTYSARLWARPPAHTHLASPNDAHPVLLIGIGPSLQHALNDLLLREERQRPEKRQGAQGERRDRIEARDRTAGEGRGREEGTNGTKMDRKKKPQNRNLKTEGRSYNQALGPGFGGANRVYSPLSRGILPCGRPDARRYTARGYDRFAARR